MRRPESIQKGLVRAGAALDQHQLFLIFRGVRAIKSLTFLFFMVFSSRKYLPVFLSQFFWGRFDDLAATVFGGRTPDGPE